MKNIFLPVLYGLLVCTAVNAADKSACMKIRPTVLADINLLENSLVGIDDDFKMDFIQRIINRKNHNWCYTELLKEYAEFCVEVYGAYDIDGRACKSNALYFAKGLLEAHNNAKNGTSVHSGDNSLISWLKDAKSMCDKRMSSGAHLAGVDIGAKSSIVGSTHYDVFVRDEGMEIKVAQNDYEAGQYSGKVVGMEYQIKYVDNDRYSLFQLSHAGVYICKVRCDQSQCIIVEAGKDATYIDE